MTSIIALSSAIEAREAESTQVKIINAIVELITEGGFATASHQRIAGRAGVSLGAVQYFGTQTQMLDAVFRYAHERYLRLVDHEALLEGTLPERVQLYVTLSWHHYQSNLHMAVLEILLSTRSRRDTSSFLNLQPELGENHIAKVRKIFPECTLDDRALLEVMRYTHCLLTGLALDKLLEPSLANLGGYLHRAVLAMTAMLED